MNRGSYCREVIGKSAKGDMVRGRVAGTGDPGNRATTKMVCKAILRLALQPDDSPGGRTRCGLLTSASGLEVRYCRPDCVPLACRLRPGELSASESHWIRLYQPVHWCAIARSRSSRRRIPAAGSRFLTQ